MLKILTESERVKTLCSKCHSKDLKTNVDEDKIKQTNDSLNCDSKSEFNSFAEANRANDLKKVKRGETISAAPVVMYHFPNYAITPPN